MDEKVTYHTERAMRELDLGLTAKSPVAADSHFRLSSLHFQRAAHLQGQRAGLDEPVEPVRRIAGPGIGR